MSGRGERAPLRITPKVSRRLGAFLLAVHGLGLFVVSMLPLEIWLKGVMAGLILLGLGYGIAGPVLHRLPWALRQAIWEPDGSWSLMRVNGQTLQGRLLSSTYVGPALVVLVFRCGRVVSCFLPLLTDNMDADLLRRLRVRLRLTGAGTPPGPELRP
jgi:hypothetical protein